MPFKEVLVIPEQCIFRLLLGFLVCFGENWVGKSKTQEGAGTGEDLVTLHKIKSKLLGSEYLRSFSGVRWAIRENL